MLPSHSRLYMTRQNATILAAGFSDGFLSPKGTRSNKSSSLVADIVLSLWREIYSVWFTCEDSLSHSIDPHAGLICAWYNFLHRESVKQLKGGQTTLKQEHFDYKRINLWDGRNYILMESMVPSVPGNWTVHHFLDKHGIYYVQTNPAPRAAVEY